MSCLISGFSSAHPLDEDVILDIEQGQLQLDELTIDSELQAAERRNRLRKLSAMSTSQRFLTYGKTGFKHILPLGWDHILFVVLLLIACQSLSQIVASVSVFTLAHAVTITLVSLFDVPAFAWTEPLIALSIVMMGMKAYHQIESNRNLTAIGDRKQSFLSNHLVSLSIIFGFGLIHGLGFAQGIAQWGFSSSSLWVSILGFNFGVEVGQFAVVAIWLGLGYLIFKPLQIETLAAKIIAILSTSSMAVMSIYLVFGQA